MYRFLTHTGKRKKKKNTLDRLTFPILVLSNFCSYCFEHTGCLLLMTHNHITTVAIVGSNSCMLYTQTYSVN